MHRISRPKLVTTRLRQNVILRNIIPSFAVAVFIICLTTLLTSNVAEAYWKNNWIFGAVRKDTIHSNLQRWNLPRDFQFGTDMPIEKIIDYFEWSNKSSCLLARDFGGTISTRIINRGPNGQKAVCLNPHEVAPVQNKCIVYSFGVKDEWSFEDSMAAYGCQVFAFNPQMDEVNIGNHKQNIRFSRLRLGSKSFDIWAGKTKRPTKTLDDIYKQLSKWHGNEATIDYLQLDVEWAEWHILPQIVESGMMHKIRQLAVKIHLPHRAPFFQHGQSLAQFRRLANIVRAVENDGMIRFHSKADIFFQGIIPALNFSGPLAYEIAWYNSRFL